LGIGEKLIALPWTDLTVNSDAQEITTELTEAEAEAAPEYVFRDQAAPMGDMATEPAATDPMTTDTTGTEPVADPMATEPMEADPMATDTMETEHMGEDHMDGEMTEETAPAN
jgi:hypothetical protein